MKRELHIGTAAILEADLLRQRAFSAGMGAVVYFSGVVREVEGQDRIRGIEYEAFLEMATRQFHLIFDRVQVRWPIESIRLVHRIGFVAVGDPSLWVEVIAPHRGEAFAACQFIIDEMKRLVPIWKRPVAVCNESF